MPYVYHVFHDYFAPDERAIVKQCQGALGIYTNIDDFETINLDGECSLDQLAAFVEGLQRVRATKQGCACGTPETHYDPVNDHDADDC